MAYPSSTDSYLNPQGTTLLSAGHAQDHRALGSTLTAIQSVLGTTAGTSVLKNFAAGNFPARINSSNVLQQDLQGTINTSVLGTPTITGGAVNAATIGTPAVIGGTIGTSLIGTSTITGGTINTVKKLTPAVGTVSDAAGGTITFDASTFPLQEVTLGTTAGNRTIAAPTNPTDGQLLTLRFKQNSNNTGTLVWNAVFVFSSEVGTPQLGTTSSWNYSAWRYHAGDVKWHSMGQSKGIV